MRCVCVRGMPPGGVCSRGRRRRGSACNMRAEGAGRGGGATASDGKGRITAASTKECLIPVKSVCLQELPGCSAMAATS